MFLVQYLWANLSKENVKCKLSNALAYYSKNTYNIKPVRETPSSEPSVLKIKMVGPWGQ